MGEQKRSLLRQLYLPAVLCTALWGSAAPCVKRGYELFAVSADAPFSQLVFAGWRFALAGILVQHQTVTGEVEAVQSAQSERGLGGRGRACLAHLHARP